MIFYNRFGSNISAINLIGHCLAADELDNVAFTNLTKALTSKKFDWEGACHVAGTHWLLPYLHYAFEQSKLVELVPEQVLTETLAVRQLVESRNKRIKIQLEEIIYLLNLNNVQPLLLKGASYLMKPISPIQRFRMTSDIDLLIPESLLNCTIETLNADGYQFSNFLPDGTDYHLDPLVKDGMPVRVELHRQPLASGASTLLNTENAWDNAELIKQHNLNYFVFKPEFRVIHQFAHAQLHSRDHANERLDLRQLFDFHLMQKKYSETINWALIENGFSADHRQIWAGYVTVANHVFVKQDRPIVSNSIQQQFRTRKIVAMLSGDSTRSTIYFWFERLMRLPLRVKSIDWYRTKFNYLLNKI